MPKREIEVELQYLGRSQLLAQVVVAEQLLDQKLGWPVR
jgi:hypothetical protein